MGSMIVEKWHQNEASVLRAGELAVDAARKAGVPAYYTDPSIGEGIVKELPDGTRQLVRVDGDRDIVLGTFGPRR